MTIRIKPLLLAAGIASISIFGSQLVFAETAPSGDDQPVQSQKHQGKPRKNQRHDRRMFFERMAKQLGLTDQQKAQAGELFKAHRAQVKPLLQTMRSERRNLRELVMSGTADDAAIRAQSAKVAAVQADMAVARADFARKIHALLTPEQQAKLKTLIQEKEKKWDDMGHEHWSHMDGE